MMLEDRCEDKPMFNQPHSLNFMKINVYYFEQDRKYQARFEAMCFKLGFKKLSPLKRN